MWPNQPYDFIKKEGDENATHLSLYINDELISIISLFVRSKERLQFCKFATHKKWQNKGCGSKLLEEVIKYFKKQSQTELYCDARIEAQQIYKHFGMVPCTPIFQRKEIYFQGMNLKK